MSASSRGTTPAAKVYDLVIVGGGIVGLATAREFLKRQPGLRLIILEKEPEIAMHQSGHNSGVIHSGIYYAPGSLKAQACVQGHGEMITYCQEHDISYELCGKVIVALDETELPRLDELHRRGTVNGVQELEMIGPERLKELEPYAAGIKALYSPRTGITDFKQVARSYAREIQEAGGEIITSCDVYSIDERGKQARVCMLIGTEAQQVEIDTSFVVTCGGLYSDKLAGMTASKNGNPQDEVRIVPFRGDYYILRDDKRFMVKGLIYPVPDPRFPFLGVHFTKRIDGEVWAGPNAVLAFAREGYKRWDINPKELAEVLTFGGFWKMASKYWQMGMQEMFRDYVKEAYVKELQRYMPELKSEDLLPGPSGVRAQAMDASGKLVDDFLIKHGEHVAHVQNAPSPAATSSLVIARMIVDEAQRSFDLART